MSAVPNSDQVRELVLGKLNNPVVFSGMIESWGCRNWTLDQWAEKLDSKELSFRQPPAQLSSVGPLWEGQCRYTRTTLGDFVRWQGDQSVAFEGQQNHPLGAPQQSDNWAYADYMHLTSLFESERDTDVLQSVDWSPFGFDGRGGGKSALWVGSRGSHTPCHYDTYGCNLVAQLIGRKRWVLFPPSDTPHLYPTRIPYEESSVFSRVDVGDPDFGAFPNFLQSRPHVVTLEPGDVLFVPSSWWHYVHSLSNSLSINSWIELDADDDRRLEESVCRALVTAIMCPCGDSSHKQHNEWINPTEEYTSGNTNVKYVCQMLDVIRSKACPTPSSAVEKDQRTTEVCSESLEKRKSCHSDDGSENKRTRFDTHSFSESVVKLMTPVCQSPFKHYLQSTEDTRFEKTKEDGRPVVVAVENDFVTKLCNAISNPEVVSLICQKLKEQIS